MTPEEITKLAKKYANETVSVRHTTTIVADEAEDVISWLLRTHCIVEKSKVKESGEVTIDGWVARDRFNNALFLHDEKPYRSFSGYQTDGKEDEWRSETCPPYPIDYNSLPDLTWESDPLEVTITIKPKKKLSTE